MIKWLANKLFPFFSTRIQNEEGMINIHRRIQKLEEDSHPPLLSRDLVIKINKRLEDLETVAFVSKFSDKYRDYEGTD